MTRGRTCLRRNVAAWVLMLATMMVTASPLHASEQSLRSLLLDEIQWNQRRTSPDVFIASIYGDTKKAQAYAFRVRAQAGHSLAPHTHIDERTVTILSGVYWTGIGETFDESKLGPVNTYLIDAPVAALARDKAQRAQCGYST